MQKSEIEKIVGCEISDEAFSLALQYAERKQARAYQLEGRKEILEPWYLTQLVAEQVKSNALTDFTLDLCRTFAYMEKEHRLKEHGTPKALPIVNVSVG